MNRFITHDLKTVSTICVLTAALSACGGSSSDSDSDNQGLFGGGVVDTDGDGLSDTFEGTLGTDPNLADTDGDGLDDGAENDIHFTNALEADSDGDGTNDGDEIANLTDPNNPDEGGTTTGGTDEPQPDQCDDLNSSNDSWADNCVLRRFGTFADSSYARGVQRILWCQNNNNEQAMDINAYADGEIGPTTDASIRAYQTANGLDSDGIVGPLTWTSLRGELRIISSTLNGFDSYSIEGCGATVAQFYQQVSTTQSADGQSFTDFLGWRMAEFPGSTTLVDFSSEL